MPFEELKARQSVMWGVGVVRACRRHPGAVALRAAEAGARVTGLDLAPDLVERARAKAGQRGLDVRFETGDAEALPYEDASFDVVCSAIGSQFAPDHAAVARELARACRPGGRRRGRAVPDVPADHRHAPVGSAP